MYSEDTAFSFILSELEKERRQEWETLLGCSFSDMNFDVVVANSENEAIFLQEQRDQKSLPHEIRRFRKEFFSLMSHVFLPKSVKERLLQLFPSYPVLITLGLRRLTEIHSEDSLPIQKYNLVEIFVRPRLRNLIPDLSFFVHSNNIEVVRCSGFFFDYLNKSNKNNKKSSEESSYNFPFHLHVVQVNHVMAYFDVQNIVLFNQIEMNYFSELLDKASQVSLNKQKG